MTITEKLAFGKNLHRGFWRRYVWSSIQAYGLSSKHLYRSSSKGPLATILLGSKIDTTASASAAALTLTCTAKLTTIYRFCYGHSSTNYYLSSL